MSSDTTDIVSLTHAWCDIDARRCDNDEVNDSLSEELERLDQRIAVATPISARDAALLAAYAWRAHNENGPARQPDGSPASYGHNDEALRSALTSLVQYLSQNERASMARIAEAWCVPLGEG